MKNMDFWLFISLIALAGCKEPKNLMREDHIPVSTDFLQEQPHTLEELIGKESYEVVAHADSLKIMKIEPVPVDSMGNEYGRVAKFIKTCPIPQKWRLETILKNENYSKAEEGKGQFDPGIQFELHYNNKRLSLLLDEKSGKLGFISLEGQTVLQISDQLKKELIEITKTNKN